MTRALIFVIAFWLAASVACAATTSDDLKRDFAANEAALALHDDGFFLDSDPGAPGLLRRRWLIAEAFVADALAARPHADDAALSAALVTLDKNLGVGVVRLDQDNTLVGLQLGEQGDVFVVAGGHGSPAAAWRLAEHAASYRGRFFPLQAWGDNEARGSCRDGKADAAWSACGAMYPTVYKLPNASDGARRFALVGSYAEFAGGTVGGQFSVWRWKDGKATPILMRLFDYSIEDAAELRVDGSALLLPVKDEFKSFSACGDCVGRARDWTFQLTNLGVEDRGKSSRLPELDLVDEAYDRLRRHKPTGDLADRSVRKLLASQIRDAEAQGDVLGMLDGWILSSDHRRLCVSTDDGGAVVFALRPAPHPFLKSAERVGDGSCSDAVHWPGSTSGS